VAAAAALAAGATYLATQNDELANSFDNMTSVVKEYDAAVAAGEQPHWALAAAAKQAREKLKELAEAQDDTRESAKLLAASASTVSDSIANAGADAAAGARLRIGLSTLIAGLGPALSKIAREQGNRVGFAVAQGITEKRDAVDDAWLGLLEAIKKPISATRETAKLLGRLVSTKLIEGMKSSDPAVRAQARATKQLILDRLEELEPRAGTLSKSAMDAVKRGMKSKDPDIRAASTAIYNAAISGPRGLTVEKGKTWGANIGKGLAAGLRSQANAVGVAAGNLASIIADYLETHSPAKLGPLSKSGGPEGWGERVGTLFGAGLASRLPDLGSVMAPTLAPAAGGGYSVPSVPATSSPSPVSVSDSATFNFSPTVVVQGLPTPAVKEQIVRELGPLFGMWLRPNGYMPRGA